MNYLIAAGALLLCNMGLATNQSQLPLCDGKPNLNRCVGRLDTKGDSYVGEFKKNRRHGYGTNKWANGESYTGYWANDKRHGLGTTVFPDGSRYEGQYENNVRNGNGTYYDVSGTSLSGYWENGRITRKTAAPPAREANPSTNNNEQLRLIGSGSGFYISSSGHFVSNFHVIKECDQVYLELSSDRIPSRIIGVDKANDLAILQANHNPKFFFQLSPEEPALLQDIYAAGFPFGDVLGASIKVTRGIVSATKGLGDDDATFQIDAALQPGNSGGPIVSETGEVIGVSVAKLDFKEIFDQFNTIPEDTNFGVKANRLVELADKSRIPNVSLRPDQNRQDLDLSKKISLGTVMVSCFVKR